MSVAIGPIHDEDSWLDCPSPEELERFLAEAGSRRRWQLFACACCWRILPLLADERSRQAVAVAERFADGQASQAEVDEALQGAEAAEVEAWQRPGQPALAFAATAARRALTTPRRAYEQAARATGSGEAAERLAQCRILRDLFGNPFRPVVSEPAWATREVIAIATEVYQADEFRHTGVLADALEDAGCAEPELLRHLRGRGPHFRGCWAVDLVVGKR
jgi:hypothetical protein